MEAKIQWAGQDLIVRLGEKSFNRECQLIGYQCFPLRNDPRNRNHGAKWLFEKDNDNNEASKDNDGYPVLFINSKDIEILSGF